jgi:hypothetical protein
MIVVDVATRAMDAEPSKAKKTGAVLKAFRKIDARKYLGDPADGKPRKLSIFELPFE